MKETFAIFVNARQKLEWHLTATPPIMPIHHYWEMHTKIQWLEKKNYERPWSLKWPYVFPHNVMQLILFYYFNVSYVDIWVSPFTLHSTAHGLLLSTLLNINTHMLVQFRFNSLVNQWGQGNSIVHVNKRSNLIPLSDPRKIMVDSEFDLNIWYIPLCCYIFLPLMRTRNW